MLTSVSAVSDADHYAFNLFRSASATDLSTANDVAIATVTCADDGTSAYTATVTSFTNDTVPIALFYWPRRPSDFRLAVDQAVSRASRMWATSR